ELAFVGAMLGDVREPQLVRRVRAELAAHEVIVRGGAGLGTLAGLALAEHGPPAVLRAALPHRPLTHIEAGRVDFVGEEPIPELRIVTMRVEQRVRKVSLVPLGIRDRTGEQSSTCMRLQNDSMTALS